MFVKVFAQILNSSIAKNYELRHFFEDMLKLADSTGVVDMTIDSISRTINLQDEDKCRKFIDLLMQPDPDSHSPQHEGRRLMPVDSHRNWGWIIVNYEHYRNIRDEEARRSWDRDYKRDYRKGIRRRPSSVKIKKHEVAQ